jgi:hypothetical protein
MANLKTSEPAIRKQIGRLLTRLSEEALIALAVLGAFTYSVYSGTAGVLTFSILFAVLVVYLSLRIIRVVGRD